MLQYGMLAVVLCILVYWSITGSLDKKVPVKNIGTRSVYLGTNHKHT